MASISPARGSFVVICGCLLNAAFSAAQPFEVKSSWPGTKPGIVLAGDFDRDGAPDVLIQDSGITLYTQSGGSFSGKALPIGLFRGYASLSAADIDGSGYPELFMTGEVPSGCCGRAPGIGLISNFATRYASFSTPSIAARDGAHASFADMDGDGDQDMIFFGSGLSTPVVYENKGGKLTVRTAVSVPASPFEDAVSAWSDFDADGDQDLVIVGTKNSNADVLEIWRNDGNFTFTSIKTSQAGCVNQCHSIVWGDVDGDGKPDVLAGSLVLLNKGAGSFQSLPTGLTQVEDGFTALLDFDGDGLGDIFYAGVPYGSTDPITDIFRNTGSGFSAQHLPFFAASNTHGAVFDFDDDGDPDIVYGSADLPLVKLYENKRITLQMPLHTPVISAAALSQAGRFSATIKNISETGAAGCALTPQISGARGGAYLATAAVTASQNTAKLAAARVAVDPRALPSFWLKVCKSCDGYRSTCSNPKLVRPRSASGIRKLAKLAAALTKQLKVSERLE